MNLSSLRMGMVVAALVGFGVGCEEEASPEEKCDDLIDIVCDRITECTNLGGQTASEYRETCHDALHTGIACDRAVAVDSSYDTCIDQLESQQCISLFPPNPVTGMPTVALPSSCRGSIKVSN